jgi:cell division transport system permease protein
MYKRIAKKTLGSYPFVSSVVTTYMALLVIGIFTILWLHTEKLTTLLKENIKIQIYLERNIKDHETSKIKKWLLNQDFVLNKNREYKVTFISRESAAKQFIKETGEDFTKILKENPLRSSYIIHINPTYINNLEDVKKKIQAQQGVFEVCYIKTIVYSLNKNLTKIKNILLTLSFLMSLIVFVLINNTIKLAIYSQRLLIRSMQLVGATNNFIRAPFIKRAIAIALISSALTIISIILSVDYTNKVLDINLIERKETYLTGIYITAASMLINLISTYRSTTKYLNTTNLDNLY